MANFTDKNTGKVFDTRAANFNAFKALITASGTTKEGGRVGADLDGKRHEFVDFGKIPFRYKQGDQAKFFPGINSDTKGGINTGSQDIVRNTVDKIVYFTISPEKYLQNQIGFGSFQSKSMADRHGTSKAYIQISQSLVDNFAPIVAAGTPIVFAAEENYTAANEITKASNANRGVSNTAPTTASITFRSPEGSASYSGIANGDDSTVSQGYQIVVDVSDSVSCHEFFLRIGSDGTFPTKDVYFEQFFPSFSLDLRHSPNIVQGTSSFVVGVGSGNNVTPTLLSYVTSSGANFFTGNSGALAVPAFTQSGGEFGVTDPIQIDKTNANEGKYRIFPIKGLAAGDSETSGSVTFFQFKSAINSNHIVDDDAFIVVYESASAVSNGTFKFVPIASGTNAATASSDVRTIHFISGANSTPGFQGIFTGSSAGLLFGSFVHKDPKLRVPADPGYYSPTGSGVAGNHVFEFNTGSLSGAGAFPFKSGAAYIPRVVRKHI
jgi:hypothetical protein